MEKKRYKQTLWIAVYVYDLHYGDGVTCVAYVQTHHFVLLKYLYNISN